MRNLLKTTWLVPVFLFLLSSGHAQGDFVPNYDESKIPPYALPDPLQRTDGSVIKSTSDWEKRKKEIFEYFQREVYGISPVWDGKMEVREISKNESAIGGTAIRQELKLTLSREGRSLDMFVLLYLPKSAKASPVFLGLNFYGNHTVTDDKDILVTGAWIRNNETYHSENNRASEKGRGLRKDAWPVEEIIGRGYGVATLYYGELDPDFDDGFKNGVHALYPQQRDSSSWGSIAGWAWGLSRMMDYLETHAGVDKKKVAVLGHSRLGKAALWAGALDERFAMVISNNSGCGGAALSRRKFGETVGRINTAFTHWFADRFKSYNDRENELLVDQHQLIALMAPRPVYIASGVEDTWADPKGEFLGGLEASPVYGLFGKEGMPVSEMPAVDQPVMGTIGYHVRSGGHGLTRYDWKQYLEFADKHWGK